MAFHTALTGHQVLSTLHTNSALATISRLFDLGLKPYMVATAIEGIIAQRLVRRVCQACAEPDNVDPDTLARLGPLFMPGRGAPWRGRGCAECNRSGYRGRLALYEVLLPDERMRHLIASILEIGQQARYIGTASLIEDAAGKVNAGATTIEEILRVLGPQ